MVSPLLSVIANFFMENFEEVALSRAGNKLMDDICYLASCSRKVEELP
jgi:hypothetical protein